MLAAYLEKLQLAKARGVPFGHYIDLRGYKPAGDETNEINKTMMKRFKEAIGTRSAVILNNLVSSLTPK